jgi:hypothetical protein
MLDHLTPHQLIEQLLWRNTRRKGIFAGLNAVRLTLPPGQRHERQRRVQDVSIAQHLCHLLERAALVEHQGNGRKAGQRCLPIAVVYPLDDDAHRQQED